MIIYQIIIFISILIAGAISTKALTCTTIFWGIWTLVKVFMLPLAIIQGINIIVACSIASGFRSSNSKCN